MTYALLVVDYQNDFVIGSLGSAEAKAIESAIEKKILECISGNGGLFFTLDTHDQGYLDTNEGMHLPVPHCIKGTPGWELHGRIDQYKEKGTIIEKETFGCLELAEIMKGYEEIEICGVATNICVIANAVILRTAFPEAHIIIDRTCVASYDQKLHEEALEVMRSLSIDIRE